MSRSVPEISAPLKVGLMPDSLIDLGKIAEPLTKLVEAVRAAVASSTSPRIFAMWRRLKRMRR